ncbi:DUF349 domain-containing protein [Nibrella saemangeumensis]|uniref:DUF349 domain-containing protein n=1 Tax=Nibrella saemangeumensis TaxID=1084526 RepID=A0ABP8MUS2_9BACT
MANEEQEINQQKDLTPPPTDMLDPNATEDAANASAEAGENPTGSTDVEATEETTMQPTQPETDTNLPEDVTPATAPNAETDSSVTADETTPITEEAAVPEAADVTSTSEDSAPLDSATLESALQEQDVTAQEETAPEATAPESAAQEETAPEAAAPAQVGDEPTAESESDAPSADSETPVPAAAAEAPSGSTDEPAEPGTEALDPAVAEEITADYSQADMETAEETTAAPSEDYSHYSKEDFVALLEKRLDSLKGESVTPSDYKKADEVLKEVRPLFDQIKQADRESAQQKYVDENGSEEGFEFKYDETIQRFDSLYKQIKAQKNNYFQQLDKAKDANFATKTELLRRLRELVEADENNAGDPKSSWNEFKQIQEEWKSAGNINSPHNATLWATYHALVDRYYSNRNIYFELKELDRKKNLTLKTEVIEKVEAMAKDSSEKPVTRQTIDEANALFEEYKHIGPAPKADQEALWQRMKLALDTLYDKRREQSEEQRKESAQLYEEKSKLYEDLVPFTSFTSNSINDWNDKTKEVMSIQERWNNLRGPMPREEGKELSKKFWAALKSFFHNKGEFFKQLESKREQNLQQKVSLCEQVEGILESGDESPEATQKVIELQRQWKTIGQVPEKQKNSIFERFKTACDAFFNRKRSKNQAVEKEFEENLAKKVALCERIEAAAKEGADLSNLNEFKREWASIGFVPKKDMQTIQKRYINAINALVGSTGKLSSKEKERVMLENEAELAREGGGGGRELYKREGDIRRRITALENDIATYRNNIEFFARSKGADKLRADIDRKIDAAQKQVDELRHQLKVIQQAQ